MSNNPLNGHHRPSIDIAERARRNALSPAEREAEDLLASTTKEIATMLLQGIAALPIAVGRGTAPHPKQCHHFAQLIAEKFSGAVLAAIEGEAATKELARIREGLEPFAEKARQFCDQPDGIVSIQMDFAHFRQAAALLPRKD